MHRRSFLSTCAVVVAAGCADIRESSTTTSTDPTTEAPTGTTATETDTTTSPPTEPDTDTPTPSATPLPFAPTNLEKHLPKEGDGWQIVDRLATDVAEIGALEAIEVVYERDGTGCYFYAIVFGSAGKALRTASDWDEIGWQVVVTKQNMLFAATTGTLTVTTTPEAPPKVPGTPVPGTVDLAVDLLARSPTLSEAYIDSNAL